MGEQEIDGASSVIQVSLTSSRVNVGNLLFGKVTLTAGPQQLLWMSLVAHLSSMELRIPPGSPSAERALFRIQDTKIGSSGSLRAGQSKVFKFKIHIPDDLDPSGTYKVVVRAELSGDAAAIAIADVKVLAPGVSVDDPDPFSEDEAAVLARYPGLRSQDAEAVRSALHAVVLDALALPELAAVLRRLAEHPDPEIRKAAAALVPLAGRR